MARSIIQIQSDIDAVRAEIGSPIQEVRFADRTQRNRTTQEALLALDALQAEMEDAEAAAVKQSRIRQVRLFNNGGFNNYGSGLG